MADLKILELGQIFAPVSTHAIPLATGALTNAYITIGDITKEWVGNVDAKTFNLSNLGTVSINSGDNILMSASAGLGYIEMGELTTPLTPAANLGRYYVKDVGAVSTPFFIGDDGVEINLTTGAETFIWTANHDANGFALLDPVFADDVDATKTLTLDLAGMTTAINGTLDFNFTTAKTITFPDATTTMVGTGIANQIGDTEITAHITTKITTTAKGQLNSNIVYTDQTNTFGAFAQIFPNTQFQLNNPANTFQYIFATSAIITADKTVTLPLLTANDIFVFEAFAQTLTNKTIDGDLNTILDINETQMNVSVGASGTVLTSNGVGVVPTYQATSGGAPFVDTTSIVEGSVDATKELRFEVDGNTTGIIGVIATAFTTAKTITVPDATDTLMGKATTDIMTNKSLALGTNTVTGTAAEFDTAVTDDNFAFVSDNLSVFAATTSLQLLGVISDESGAGLLVFNDTPTIITPTIASFANSTHDHQAAAGGGTLLSTAALSDTADIAYLNTANVYTAGTRQDFLGLLAGTAGLNVGAIAGNPTTQVNGDIWLNSTSNTMFGRINGVNVDLGAGAGGEVFTWTADHSMATFKLTATAANDVILNAPTGQGVSIEVNAIQEYDFDAAQANFLANNLINVGLLRLKIDNATAVYEMEANHTTPADAQIVGQIDFIDDSSTGVRRTYGQIRTLIEDPSNTAEDGEMIFSVIQAGALTDYISLNLANGSDVTFHKAIDISGNTIKNTSDILLDSEASHRIDFERPTAQADGYVIGELRFRHDDGGLVQQNYGRITTVMESDVAANEDGSMHFFVTENGVHDHEWMNFNNNSDSQVNIISAQINFSDGFGIEWADNNDRFIVNSTTGTSFGVETGDNYRFFINGVVEMVFTVGSLDLGTGTAGTNILMSGSGANGYIEMGAVTTPGTPADGFGRFYTKEVSTITTPFFIGDDGVEQNLTAAGSEVFTWSANHDANSFALEDARFADDTDNTKIIDLNLVGMTTGIVGTLDFNFTTAKTITFPDATTTMIGTGIANQITNTELTAGAFAKITGVGTIASGTWQGDVVASAFLDADTMHLGVIQTVTSAKTFNDTTLLLRNVANTFNGSFVNTNTIDRIYTLPDAAGTVVITGLANQIGDTEITAHTSTKISTTNKSLLNSAIVYNDQTNTFADTLDQIFHDSDLHILDDTNSFAYKFRTASLAAERFIDLPPLTANDTFVFANHIATLVNKTLTTPTIASFVNSTHDHQAAAGGGTLLSTAALSDTATIAYLNTANVYTAGTRQDFLGLLAGTAGLNVGGIAGNPTTQVNGDVWLNTSTNQIFGRINGTDVDLGAGAGGEVFTWTADHDTGGNALTLTDDATPPAGTVAAIYLEGGELNANVATGNLHQWRINDVVEMTFDGSLLDLEPGTFVNINLANGADIEWTGVSTRRIRNDSSGFEFDIETGDSFEYAIQGLVQLDFTAANFDLSSTTATNILMGSGAFVQMGENAADPAAGTTSGKFYVKEVGGLARPFFIGDGTAAVALDQSGSEVTTWTADHDAADFDLLQIDNITSGANNLHNWDISRDANLADGTKIGNVRFRSFDGLGVPMTYGRIEVEMENDDNGSENGSMQFYTTRGGIDDLAIMAFNNGGTGFIDVFRTMNILSGFQIQWGSDGNRRIFNDLSGFIFEVPTGDNFDFQILNTSQMTLDAADLILPTNNLVLTAGDVTLNGGDINLNAGEINVTSGVLGDILKHTATGFQRFAQGTALQHLRVNAGGTDLEWADPPAGGGDMVLADAQTVTGIKTFLDTTMKLRNVANTFDAFFVNTVTAERIYTLPDFAGTVLISGNNQIVDGDVATGVFGSITGIGTQAQDLVMNGNSVNLGAAGTIFFSAADTSISEQAGSMFFDVPTTESFSFDIAGTPEIVIDGTVVTLATNNLILTAGFLQFSDVNTTITDAAGIMQYDVASTFSHDFRINNTIEAQLTATIFNLPNGAFQEAGVNISPIGLHDVYIDGGGFAPVDSSGLAKRTIGSGINQKAIILTTFSATADQYAVTKVTVPENYDGGVITVVVSWTNDTTGTGSVVWAVAAVNVSDGDDLNAAATNYSTNVILTADVGTTLNLEHKTARSGNVTPANTYVAGDTMYIKISRLASSEAGDDFTQTADLLGISVRFGIDAAVAA